MEISKFLNKNFNNSKINKVILNLCDAAIKISQAIKDNSYDVYKVSTNSDGDIQKELDIFSDQILLNSIKNADVSCYCSEEQDGFVNLNEYGDYVVITDPLDGSSNIETNVSIGTIFSILPRNNLKNEEAVKQLGINQLCSGFFVYGPRTTLFLTLKHGTHLFLLNHQLMKFELICKDVTISETTSEYAINSSYERFWNRKVKNYIKNCQKGKNGPRNKDFNMRWVGSLVADASRIFNRGGIFLYPNDLREKNKNGRLRLTYEANPIALLVKNAGGKSTDGIKDILYIEVNDIHQRTPFIFGSKEEVDTFLNSE